MLEFVALGTRPDAANDVADQLGGSLYVHEGDPDEKRPYTTLLRAVTDSPEALAPAADVALHLAFARPIKAPAGPPSAERLIASFPLRRHPDLSHRQADDHWRDTHAPLALTHHSAMCDYTQLSIAHTIDGRELDGIAMCAFDNADDLHTRFYNDEAAEQAIVADVTTFADVRRSPRRVVLRQVR
ncbi:MAG: EthD domain-containing protein [Actinomycetota bacterium]